MNLQEKKETFELHGVAVNQDLYKVNSSTKADINLPLSDKTKLASSITKPADGQTSTSVNYSFTTWTSNDQKREIDYTITFSIGGNTKNISGKISGFAKSSTNSSTNGVSDITANLDGTISSDGTSSIDTMVENVKSVRVTGDFALSGSIEAKLNYEKISNVDLEKNME